jgi:hypothetical protein
MVSYKRYRCASVTKYAGPPSTENSFNENLSHLLFLVQGKRRGDGTTGRVKFGKGRTGKILSGFSRIMRGFRPRRPCSACSRLGSTRPRTPLSGLRIPSASCSHAPPHPPTHPISHVPPSWHTQLSAEPVGGSWLASPTPQQGGAPQRHHRLRGAATGSRVSQARSMHVEHIGALEFSTIL